MTPNGTLFFFCGKMAAGKSTLAAGIARDENAVLLSEDAWLAQLYRGQIASFDDYVRLSRQMRPIVKQLVQDMLRVGTHVVMDFPANTVTQRSWYRTLAEEVDASHRMIYLDASDETCLRQLDQRRREQPERAALDTAEVFHQVTGYFEEPSDSEQLNVTRVEVNR